jgi:hypothetical protein
MDVREIGSGDVYWIDSAQYRDRWWVVLNPVMNEDGCLLGCSTV